MGKRRLGGSRFDLLPLADLADLAAVAADEAMIDALSGRAPDTVPPAGDPVAELLFELLAVWACPVSLDNRAWLVRYGSPPMSAQGALYERRACGEAVFHPLQFRCRSRVPRRPGRVRGWV
jgi:hypothetical protein